MWVATKLHGNLEILQKGTCLALAFNQQSRTNKPIIKLKDIIIIIIIIINVRSDYFLINAKTWFIVGPS